jgi:hypothetical protein
MYVEDFNPKKFEATKYTLYLAFPFTEGDLENKKIRETIQNYALKVNKFSKQVFGGTTEWRTIGHTETYRDELTHVFEMIVKQNDTGDSRIQMMAYLVLSFLDELRKRKGLTKREEVVWITEQKIVLHEFPNPELKEVR